MKKLPLMLLAGGAALFASCTQEPASNATSQAQIDSAVNAIVEQREAEMYASNDSMIMAMSVMRADSIIAARAGKTIPGRTVRTTPPPRTTPATPTTPVAPPVNPKADRLKQDAGEGGKIVPTEEQTKSKKDRLNKDAGN